MRYDAGDNRRDSRRDDRKGRGDAADKKKMVVRKKICRFCSDPDMIYDYKEPKSLLPFTTEKGKMIPRRVTGNCAFHQRRIGEAIGRARILALLPCGGNYIPPA